MQLGTHAPYEWNLLLNLLPVFVENLPSGRYVDRISNLFLPIVRTELELINLEILQEAHLQRPLQHHEFELVLQAIRSLLQVFEDLVDNEFLKGIVLRSGDLYDEDDSFQFAKLNQVEMCIEAHRWPSQTEIRSIKSQKPFRKVLKSDEVKRLRSVVSKSYDTLAGTLLKPLDEIGVTEPEQLANISDEEMELISQIEGLSDVANSLFDLLAVEFGSCNDKGGYHEVKLNLEEFRHNRWSFFISPCDTTDIWQPVVCLHHEKKVTRPSSIPGTPKDTICNTLRSSKRHRKTLHLGFSNDTWWKDSPRQHIAFNPRQNLRSSRVRIHDLIIVREHTSSVGSFEPADRKRFAALLGQSILYLYDSPWMQGSCLKRLFYLHRPEDTAPFLSYVFSPGDSESSTTIADPLHEHAFVVNFGIFLSELESQEHYSPDMTLDSDFETGEFSPTLMLTRILESSNFSRRVEAGYQAIIKACLDFDELVDALYHPHLTGALRCRAALLKHIIYPLVSELSLRYPESTTGLIQQSSVDPAQHTKSLHRHKPNDSKTNLGKDSKTQANQQLSSSGEKPVKKSPLRQIVTASPLRAAIVQPLTLFEDTSSSLSCDTQSIVRAQDFLDLFKSFQHLHSKPNEGRTRIKIAVLDTGLDEEDDMFMLLRRRILEQRKSNGESDEGPIRLKESFVGGDVGDRFGHGTQMATTIMSYAPQANIYVAKISHDTSVEKIDHIEKAIEWAIKHEVDIISMSFGIASFIVSTEGLEKVRSAIGKAASHNILMFAAASNCGGNGSRTYPASDSRVFCVHAVDGKGDDKGFNPPLDHYRDSYGTLGVGLKFTDGGAIVHKSGTSYATPVMASIAANVLDYSAHAVVHGHLDKSTLNYLHEYDGMEKMLKFMSSKMDRHEYVTPWRLWKPSISDDYIYMKLRNEL